MRVDGEGGPGDVRSDPCDWYDCLRSRLGGPDDREKRASDESDENVGGVIHGKSQFMSLPNLTAGWRGRASGFQNMEQRAG
jgi:hypothetical protein